MDVGKLSNHVNTVLCVWLFFFWRFLFSIFLFLSSLKFRLNSQHVQIYDDMWKLIILYPIDLRIIFSKFLLQPGPPKYSFLATPLKKENTKRKTEIKIKERETEKESERKKSEIPWQRARGSTERRTPSTGAEAERSAFSDLRSVMRGDWASDDDDDKLVAATTTATWPFVGYCVWFWFVN